jgi:hypothetical protein
MGVARMEFQLATTANLFELCLGWPGSAFIKLVRETLSKNAVLPGLTYFYCNWVSQAGNVLPACESERRRRSAIAPAVIAPRKLSRKARGVASLQLPGTKLEHHRLRSR